MGNAWSKSGKMKMLAKKEWNNVFKKVPRVTVDLIVKDKRGVLLVKRSITPWKGKWHFPGGTVFYKEKLLDAVKRKAKEETGLKIKIKKFLGVLEFMGRRRPGYSHIVDLVFLVEPISGRLKGDPKLGGKVLKFFKKIPKNIISEHRKALEGKLLK